MFGRLAESLLGLRASSLENPSTSLAAPARWLLEWAGGGQAQSGVAVNEEKALGVPLAYACTSLLSRLMASMPLHVMRRKGKFAEPAPEHWAQALLSKRPNLLHTAFVWRQQMMVHALLWGNHYAVIDMEPSGEVSFLPLLPWNVRVELTSSGKRKVYVVRLMDGSDKVFREDQILHIPALGTDGLVGISPVRKLRNMYGLSIASETFVSKFFANDARPSVIMEVPGEMNEQAQLNLTESLYKKFSGAENKWKVLVLEEGAKMHMVQMPLKDVQFLEERQLQDSLICSSFGVPPHMVGLVDKVSSWGTGVEEMSLGLAKYTLTPWCELIEQELDRKLFEGSEYFAKFNLNGLQRGDFKSRMEGYQIGVQNGVTLIDEARALEDMPPLPDGLGQKPIIPANMQLLENAAKDQSMIERPTREEQSRYGWKAR